MALWGYFLVLFGAIFGVGVRFKNIFGTYLCSLSILVLELQPYIFAFTLAKFEAFFALFGPFGAIFGVGVRFKNIFGTYLCSQSTLVLEVQPYLFAFTLAKFEAFFALFGPMGAIFRVEVRFKKHFWDLLTAGILKLFKEFEDLKHVLEPSKQDKQLSL